MAWSAKLLSASPTPAPNAVFAGPAMRQGCVSCMFIIDASVSPADVVLSTPLADVFHDGRQRFRSACRSERAAMSAEAPELTSPQRTPGPVSPCALASSLKDRGSKSSWSIERALRRRPIGATDPACKRNVSVYRSSAVDGSRLSSATSLKYCPAARRAVPRTLLSNAVCGFLLRTSRRSLAPPSYHSTGHRHALRKGIAARQIGHMQGRRGRLRRTHGIGSLKIVDAAPARTG